MRWHLEVGLLEGDWVFDEGMRVGPHGGLSALIRKGKDTRALCS